jgi:esterase/lipase superfamily enzyme
VKREQHTWYSHALGREMGLLLYGHGGQPLLAFPSQDGRFWDWEGFGMIDAVAGLLESGRLTIAAIDSIDGESWTNQGLDPRDRARRHEGYERYVVDEVLPLLRGAAGPGHDLAWASGASMGAFHAANLFFRRPDLLNGLIAISGVYGTRMFVGDAGGDEIYFHSPLQYLPNLADPWHLERYRRSQIVFVTGQGEFEDDSIADTRAIQQILHEKGVDATVDYWGHDVEHHWRWWGQMLRHHLERMLAASGQGSEA